MKKSIVLSGSTGIIGEQIALKMCKKDFDVILLGRNEGKLSQQTKELVKKTGNKSISYRIVDLSLQKSILNLRNNWGEQKIDVLINCAAVVPLERKVTSEGIEMQFATNVLGYYWMIEYFKDILIESSPSKIVIVASEYAHGFDHSDPMCTKKRYVPRDQYSATKQCCRMLSWHFGRQLVEKEVFVNSCHPGVTTSNLLNNLGYNMPGWDSAEKSARVPVFLATKENEPEYVGYCYRNGKREEKYKNPREIEKLLKICESYRIKE